MKKIPGLFLLFLAVSLQGLSVEGLDISGGLLWVANPDAEDEPIGAPSPLTQKLSVQFPVQLLKAWVIEPGISVYSLYYAYRGGLRPRPAQIEHREMQVITLVFDVNMLFPIAISETLTVSPGFGAGFLLHLPAGTAPGETDRFDELLEYLHADGRFFMPGGFIKLRWDFSPRFAFVFRPGTRLPLFNSASPVPLHDRLQVYTDIGVSFRL